MASGCVNIFRPRSVGEGTGRAWFLLFKSKAINAYGEPKEYVPQDGQRRSTKQRPQPLVEPAMGRCGNLAQGLSAINTR